MATRIVILSGVAAFGLGLLMAGELFREPGGEATHARRQAEAQTAAMAWDLWRPDQAGGAPDAAPPPEAASADAVPDEPAPDAPAGVWATPAEWSEVE